MKLFKSLQVTGVALLIGVLSSCSKVEPVAFFDRGEFPKTLSSWRLLAVSKAELVPNEGVIAYDLKSALFTDYANKFRTVYVPEGSVPASMLENGGFDLPVGSILTKTFFYPKAGLLKVGNEGVHYTKNGLNLFQLKLIETRLLVHTQSGWVGLPYIWNEEGTEAFLEITGGQMQVSFAGSSETINYAVPDFNQCQGCHIENLTAGVMAPVGFKAHHIDKAYPYLHKAGNQLDHLAEQGVIEVTQANVKGIVDWQDESASLEDRARSYLDINCGHCHNDAGPADTSGMFLTRSTSDPIRLGVCKPPVAAGQGTGGRPVGIHPGSPEESILTYRMDSLDLGAMMPELGRSLVHAEGVALVEAWIREMEGGC